MPDETKSDQVPVSKDEAVLPTTPDGDTVIGGEPDPVLPSLPQEEIDEDRSVAFTREGCEAMLSSLEEEIGDLDREILRLTRQRDTVSGEIDRTRKMIEKEFPPMKAAEVYQKFIASQQRMRYEQTQRAQEAAAMLPGRISAKSGASPIDRALSSRPRDPALVQPLRGA